MPPQKPSIILIRVDNSVNTKVVEQVKNELKAQLGECTMLIEVEREKVRLNSHPRGFLD